MNAPRFTVRDEVLDRAEVEPVAQIVRHHELPAGLGGRIDETTRRFRVAHQRPFAHHVRAVRQGRENSRFVLAGRRADEHRVERRPVRQLIQRRRHEADLEAFRDRPGLGNIGVHDPGDVHVPESLQDREVDDLGRSSCPHYGDVHGA